MSKLDRTLQNSPHPNQWNSCSNFTDTTKACTFFQTKSLYTKWTVNTRSLSTDPVFTVSTIVMSLSLCLWSCRMMASHWIHYPVAPFSPGHTSRVCFFSTQKVELPAVSVQLIFLFLYSLFIIFKGYGHILENGYRKTFSWEFVVVLNQQKDWKTVQWAAGTRHHQMHTDWTSAID